MIKFYVVLFFSCTVSISKAQQAENSRLALKIQKDTRLDTVQRRALRLLDAFVAGTSYGEVWIRDLNTFIKGSLKVHPKEKVEDILLYFFKFQGPDGNIPDGYIEKSKADKNVPPGRYIFSALAPEYLANKNTVETDQETSLIQAVKKYIDVTNDRSILYEKIGKHTVLKRMEFAFEFLLKHRWSSKYDLVTGATTVDWGDVQPDTSAVGIEINHQTKWAIDIYDNAMFYMALNDFMAMIPEDFKPSRNWSKIVSDLKQNICKHLWQADTQKYIPHIYLDGTPFSKDFDESEMLYSGGSAMAILAGLNSPQEIANINNQLLAITAKEAHATIGITVYPPYPLTEFPNMGPYTYQNGGDWAWFGGRFLQGLIQNGFIEEAYAELDPMVERVLKQGFNEWYDVRTGEAKGSGEFRGEAGVLYDTINMLRTWANDNK